MWILSKLHLVFSYLKDNYITGANLEFKKITLLISSSILLNGCIETTALLGPAVTGGTSGNVYQASISFVSSETISKTTGNTHYNIFKNWFKH